MSNGSKVFSVLVVGDKPEELLAKYDENLKVDKYIKYSYSSMHSLRTKAIKLAEEVLKNKENFKLSKYNVDYFEDKLNTMKSMSDFEYYSDLTQGLYIDGDGNAWDNTNKDGKFQTCQRGKNFSIPFIMKDGKEVNSCKKGEVDWDKMHMSKQTTTVYDKTWDLCHGIIEPSTSDEHKIYDNMSNLDGYFDNFKNKTEFVIHNCAYWNYAFLDENGWKDIDDSKSAIEWVATYFDLFIKPLDKDTKITIFECTKGKEK